MPDTDNALPENDQKNLDRKLDHAIEETFPTSDPVSVSVTKGGAIDYDTQQPAAQGRSEKGQTRAEGLAGQAQETLETVTAAATDTARAAYEQGKQYVDTARERYPEAERYYREGSQTIREYAVENPLLTLLAGVGIGYVLAWMIHSGGSDQGERLPDHARTRHPLSRSFPQPRC